MQISWQVQHFRAFHADFVAGAVLSSLRADVVAGAPARCVAVHFLKMQSEPSAHFGWVQSLSLWRGAHFANAK